VQLCIDAFLLVGKGTLRPTEGFRNLTIGNLRIVKTHLDDTVSIRVEFAVTLDKLCQQKPVLNYLLHAYRGIL